MTAAAFGHIDGAPPAQADQRVRSCVLEDLSGGHDYVDGRIRRDFIEDTHGQIGFLETGDNPFQDSALNDSRIGHNQRFPDTQLYEFRTETP